ncbi:MAG: apolipoprotein N-acyltransferase [Candidatus Nanopelagicaceae bacterium]|nr:apolipoprotein N-acyltransferase [Candidatus Nanopelagicaceae bacterium]
MAIALTILAGFFLWGGFAPLEFAFGPYIGAALFYRSMIDKELRERIVLSFFAGLAFFLPLLHWSGSYVGWVPWVSLALLQTTIFTSLGFFSWKRNISSVFLFAAFFTLIEIVRMKWPFGGFGWGRVGHTQVEYLSGFYSVVGVAGVTFTVVFLASLFAIFKVKTMALFPIPLLIGVFIPLPASTGSIKVAAVQGGVDELGFDYNKRALSVLTRHAEATVESINEADLVVWPENASDIDPLKNQEAALIIQNTIAEIGKPLLVGAVLRENLGPKNVSILYNEKSEIESMYVKQDLAPFGEYIPIRKVAEFVSAEAKRVKDFQPGKEWIHHQVSGRTFQSVICFEVLDDDFIREGLSKAEFVVAQTNNATFGKSPQARQQLQIIRARAAEFQRDFSVVSTTGFTAHVDSKGEIVKSLEQFKAGTLEMNLETHEERSLASRIGSWAWVGVFLAALAVSRRSVFSR